MKERIVTVVVIILALTFLGWAMDELRLAVQEEKVLRRQCNDAGWPRWRTGYCLNDLETIPFDRRHERRPFQQVPR